ncbi:MAG TPA: PQQ-binding-like beta-propeller repeat protein [Bryobacteraceae bacterium]|nr:PQQ-binding-like beta-propeller repeat protein [Bryobacteraceae bacterium]
MRTATIISVTVGFFLAGWMLADRNALAQQPRRVDDNALKNAGKTGEDWISYGLTPGETRYSPLNAINTGNVSRLGLAWSYDLGKGGGNQEGTPLEYNGTIYGITNWSIVWAVDARTGKEKWRWDPEVNQTAVRPKICCGIVNRGIAMYNGKIIAPVNDGRLVGLDMETGKPLWESRVAYSQDNYTLTMAPRIAHGKVIVGVSGAEYPVRGFFAAFDADNGRQAWKFYTVPGDPSKGFENAAMKKAAETWEGEWWKMGGGATVWDGMAYDPDTDLFYVGTGNAGPWPEAARKQSKGKDNLFAASIVAVKADTGEYKWHFQMVPGDEWDYDSVQQLVLADVTIRGQKRKVIMQANKNGFYYVIDRTNGQFISGQPFAQVTWAKGLNEATGRPIVNQEAYYGKNTITLAPGPGGAHNWAPMSFNPNTGLIYIPASTTSTFSFAVDENFKFQEGRQNMGIVFGRGPTGGRGPAAGTGTGATPETTAAAAAAAGRGNAEPPPAGPPPQPPSKLPSPPAIGPTPPSGERGALVAWDVVTQKEKWHVSLGGGIGGGTVTTAGNLVFQVVPDGRLFAYSADKGEKLLEVQTGLRGGMGPPITYMLDGKQYVALAGGMGNVVNPFQPPPPPPGATGAAAPPPPPPPQTTAPVLPKLLVFELDGKGTLPVPEPTPASK